MPVTDFFKDYPYPKWFLEHPIWKEVQQIKKVFPSLGLSNCESEVELDNGLPAQKSAATLLRSITQKLIEKKRNITNQIKKHPDKQEKGKQYQALIDGLLTVLTKQKKTVITVQNGRIAIKLPADITLEGATRPTFRAQESLFRVYNKLNTNLHEDQFATMTKLEDIPVFKTFSTENIPNNKFKLVFSSNGANGAWDIATMSMRGIRSCQSWNGDYPHCLIGSVIDPFVGILYLTSGSKYNGYGSKMMKRSVVRFVIDEETSKPYILLDYLYPSADKKIVQLFVNFLKEKTNNKFPVVYSQDADYKLINRSYLPLTPIRKKLEQTTADGEGLPNGYDLLDSIQSYQDMKIRSKPPGRKDKHTELFEKNAKKKADKFINDYAAAMKKAVDTLPTDKMSEPIQPIVKQLQTEQRNFHAFNYSFVVPEIARTLASSIVKSIDKKDFGFSHTYAKRLYHTYFTKKNVVLNDKVKDKVAKTINTQLGLRKNKKLNAAQMTELMRALEPGIELALKEELKEMTADRKRIKPLPLPE